jgi:hypothetical protein
MYPAGDGRRRHGGLRVDAVRQVRDGSALRARTLADGVCLSGDGAFFPFCHPLLGLG